MMDMTKLKAIRSALDEIIGAESPKPTPQVTGTGGNIYGGGKPDGPWDQKWPGYVSGDANQIMLRKYARQSGETDSNKYVKDRGLTPRWPDEKQDWEAKLD